MVAEVARGAWCEVVDDMWWWRRMVGGSEVAGGERWHGAHRDLFK